MPVPVGATSSRVWAVERGFRPQAQKSADGKWIFPWNISLVVTGATGGLGSQVLKSLLTLVPPRTLRISTPDPRKVPAHIHASGVQIVRGDYGDPASLDAAFAGAERVLLVSYPSIAHDERVRMHTTAIDAAKRAGVRHVFYTSLAFDPAGGAAVMRAHRDSEAYLKASGLTYTIIREGIYSESYPLYFGFFQPNSQQTDVYVPGDGGVAWVNREDLGEGTAEIIFDSDAYANKTVLLSGSEALTLSSVASLLSTHLARPIKLHVVSEDEYVRAHEKPGGDVRSSPEFLRLWATTYPALAAGECARVDGLLEELLRRKPKSFEESLKESLKEEGAIERYAK